MHDKYNSMLEEWFDRVWNKGEETAIDELMDANSRNSENDPPTHFAGIDHIKSVFRKLHHDFTDIHMKVDQVQKNNGEERGECTVTAMYRGKPLEIKCPVMIRMENNKIVKASNDIDLRLMGAAAKLSLTGQGR